MIVYKVLDQNGYSIYQRYQWPRPVGKRKGRWLKINRNPILCSIGFHGYLTLERAERDCKEYGYQIYEMELRGAIVVDNEKAAASEARLVRLIPDEPVLVTTGYRKCVDCGKEHSSYKRRNFAPQWNDLNNGHPYTPEPWETYAERVTSELELVKASKAEQTRARQEHDPLPPNMSYHPVAPSFHSDPFKHWPEHPDKCGWCGLGKDLHDGWEERAALADEFQSADRWELLLVIQHMRRKAY